MSPRDIVVSVLGLSCEEGRGGDGHEGVWSVFTQQGLC